jgi:hypothetical protein
MRVERSVTVMVLSLAVVLAGCGGESAPPDAGMDAGTRPDAASAEDARVSEDAQVSVDTGADDAGADDAGAEDAGRDSGEEQPDDASLPDAGPPDAGRRDGGTCGPAGTFPCCYDDADCGSGTRCVGETCPSALGTCVTETLARGECWEDADCADGRSCTSVNRCLCAMLCVMEDSPGRCGAPS